MVVIPVTIDGLKAVATWIGSIGNWKHTLQLEKKAETKAALESLLDAVRDTRIYLAKLRDDPANVNYDTQRDLSQLWAKAGTAMMTINQELAIRYVLKADYWSDPRGWEGKNNDKLLIELDEVFRLGREALFGK
jgi:hypothetical protein